VFEGSCLCGGIRYRLSAEPGDFGYCHCASCRKAGGSGHSANAPIARADFHVAQGGELLREYESSPGKVRAFCSRCGSPIYAYQRAAPDVLRLRLGSLDTPFQRRPLAHTWVSDKAPWEPIDDDLPQFDTFAPPTLLRRRGTGESR
jgi:hypothetical protein